MKKIPVVLLMLISLSCFAQKQDSVVQVNDSVPTISVNDINALLNFYYDQKQISPKDYDLIRSFKDVLLNYTRPRRQVVFKKK